MVIALLISREFGGLLEDLLTRKEGLALNLRVGVFQFWFF